MSILDSLFNGSIRVLENMFISEPEFRELENTVAKEKRYFKEMIPQEDLKRYENLDDAITDSNYIFYSACFQEGVRLGSMIMFEIFAAI